MCIGEANRRKKDNKFNTTKYNRINFKIESGIDISSNIRDEIVRSKNSKNNYNLSIMLRYCCEHLKESHINLLIKHGASPTEGVHGDNCFHFLVVRAIYTSDEKTRLHIFKQIKFLLTKCNLSEKNPLDLFNGFKQSCLSIVLNKETPDSEVLTKLVEFGANVNAHNFFRMNILNNLLSSNRKFKDLIENVRVLIKSDLNINIYLDFKRIMEFHQINFNNFKTILNLLVDNGLIVKTIHIDNKFKYNIINIISLMLTVGFDFDVDPTHSSFNEILKFIKLFPPVLTLRTYCIRTLRLHQVPIPLWLPLIVLEWPDEMELLQ